MTLQTFAPEKFPLISMGGRAEGLACADPGARTPIGASGNLNIVLHNMIRTCMLKRNNKLDKFEKNHHIQDFRFYFTKWLKLNELIN